jgi:hypothetical protein
VGWEIGQHERGHGPQKQSLSRAHCGGDGGGDGYGGVIVRREHGHGPQKQPPSRVARGDDGERQDEQHFGYARRFQGQRDHDRGAQSPGYDDHGDDGGGGGGAAREDNEHGYLEIRPSVQCGHLLRIPCLPPDHS